jgi:carbonic anhydrase/acetyltransferase-like protein (isoleucine patch superfamily)
MPIIKAIKGVSPQIEESCYIADNAVITGDVQLGKNCSIWFHTVIRGDVNKIIIGDNVNIQDLSMVHGTVGRGDTIIGNNVSVGHRAIIHGCQIQDNVLIGMGAIVLDDTIIESNVIVAAGAVVTSNQVLKSGFLYAGIPAKPIKEIEPEMAQVYIQGTAQGYVEYQKLYK